MKEPSVAAGMTNGFLAYAVAQGLDRSALLQAAGIGAAALDDPDNRIGMGAYRRLLDVARAQSGDPALHIRYTLDTRFEEISIVGLLVHNTPSMAESMRQFARYSKLLVEVDVMAGGSRFQLEHRDDGLWIVDHCPRRNLFAELTETSFGRFIGEFRKGFPDRHLSLELSLTHAAPEYATAAQALYGIPVAYGAGFNGLRMAPEWLRTEFERPNTYAFGLFAEKAEALMQGLECDSSLRARVEAALLNVLHEGDISMDRIADKVAMSRQTLYRHLKKEGTSFAAIVDALRRHMAEDYLATGRASINQVAYLVGFSEPSSFMRAFRRWTGVTPRQFRDRARQPKPTGSVTDPLPLSHPEET